MVVDQLRQLVRHYISGRSDYASFRREFVVNFLSVRHDDALLDRLCHSMESLCSDFSQGHFVDEVSMKAALARTALPLVAQSVQVVTHMPVIYSAFGSWCLDL